MIAGTNGASYGMYYLIKTDSTGNSLWAKTYLPDNINSCVSAVQAPDGGFTLVGSASDFTNYNICPIKTDASGQRVW
jgi:hypothetical protein